VSNSTVDLCIQRVGPGGRKIVKTVGTLPIKEGILVAQLAADGTIVPASTALSGPAIGVSLHAAAAGAELEIETDAEFLFSNGTAGDACSEATLVGHTVYCYDDHTIADNSSSGTRFSAGVFLGMIGSWVRLYVTPGTSAATVEAAIAEIYQHLLSATTTIPLSLYQFREVDANGDVGNASANGGILASDTTPIMRGDSAESAEINWAASNSDPISTQISLPADFDGTKNVTIDCWVNSGTTDAASLVLETGWDGGALVSDALDDSSTKSATTHKLTATVAAADIPDTASYLTLAITPPAHTTNAISLVAIRINYKRKLMTS
jgi:hypothetical protein